ncbi:MAG: hypothetical protein P2A85_22545 [Microcoleus anatoxicus]|uniref:hypothetical protein n=1 Tax=Microcoleus anatoxicus TaxID=2705319 RepID=UPI0036723278
MIALIVPRREAGAAGGLPHFGLAAGVGLVRSPFVRSALAQQPRSKLIRTHILHHSQEQAGCLFHKNIEFLWNRHLACS